MPIQAVGCERRILQELLHEYHDLASVHVQIPKQVKDIPTHRTKTLVCEEDVSYGDDLSLELHRVRSELSLSSSGPRRDEKCNDEDQYFTDF